MSIENLKRSLQGRQAGGPLAYVEVNPRDVVAVAGLISKPCKRTAALLQGAAGALEGIPEEVEPRPVHQVVNELFYLIEQAEKKPAGGKTSKSEVV